MEHQRECRGFWTSGLGPVGSSNPERAPPFHLPMMAPHRPHLATLVMVQLVSVDVPNMAVQISGYPYSNVVPVGVGS